MEKMTQEPTRESNCASQGKKEGEIRAIDLHAFADMSGNGVATTDYATVFQETGTSQELLTAKARIAKKGLTIPRLELVAGHMAANVVDNVKRVLQGYTQGIWLA